MSLTPSSHPPQANELFFSDLGLEGSQKKEKNIHKLFLKDPSPMDDALCRVQRGGWQSAEPHAEITVFELVRKVIEKQTSVSLSAL